MHRFVEQSPFFTDDHRRLAASVASFARREIEPHAARAEEATDEDFRALVALLADADLLRHCVRRDSPLDVRSLCLVREELAYSSALADAAFVMQGLGTYAVSLAAPAHVREFWLARAAAGKAVAAFALTEPDAGSDVSAITTTARRDGDAYVLDGRKHLISSAGVADFYTVFARTATRADGRAEMSAFLVSSRMPGFRVSARTQLMAAHPIGEIEFENLRLPAEDRIGDEGDGHRLAMRTMNVFRPSVGAAACGMARRALDEAVSHAKRRRQFGAPLSSYQLVQAKLAEMATDLDAARLLVYHAAHARDAQPDDADADQSALSRAASEAKLFATEAAQRVIDESVQIHGGAGLVRGSVVERLYRDIRALRIYEGTSEIQKLIIAREMLKE